MNKKMIEIILHSYCYKFIDKLKKKMFEMKCHDLCSYICRETSVTDCVLVDIL